MSSHIEKYVHSHEILHKYCTIYSNDKIQKHLRNIFKNGWCQHFLYKIFDLWKNWTPYASEVKNVDIKILEIFRWWRKPCCWNFHSIYINISEIHLNPSLGKKLTRNFWGNFSQKSQKSTKRLLKKHLHNLLKNNSIPLKFCKNITYYILITKIEKHYKKCWCQQFWEEF